jgi:hypothetical protein
MEELGAEDRTIIKRSLKRCDMMLWTGFRTLTIEGTSGRFCKCSIEHFGYINTFIPWLSERL